MNDGPRKASPPPENREFDSSYNELPAANPLFTEYSQSQGAPNGTMDRADSSRSYVPDANSVIIDRNADGSQRVQVDGRDYQGVTIGHADNVNIYDGSGPRTQQEYRAEYRSGDVFDRGYSDLPPSPANMRFQGNRPLYGPAADDMFYQLRGMDHHRGSSMRTRAWSYDDYSSGPVVIDDRQGWNRGYDGYQNGHFRCPEPRVDFRYSNGMDRFPPPYATPPFVPAGYDMPPYRPDYDRGSGVRDAALVGLTVASLIGAFNGDRHHYGGGRNNFYNQNHSRLRVRVNF